MKQTERSNLTEIKNKAGFKNNLESFLWLPPLLSPIPKQLSLIILAI